jgi:CubicO group peptidase (beta-lactamase class C family)
MPCMKRYVRINRAPAGMILGAFAALAACAPPEHAPGDGIARGIEVFTWSVDEKATGFRQMESLFPASVVENGTTPRPLPRGRPLQAFEEGGAGAERLARFMEEEFVSGLLVLHEGKIRLERYALGHGPDERWTSFSVAKSITSTLVGAAIRDGYIAGLDDAITQYITELKGTAYEGVTVRHLLTMTSGVAFNEDYGDPDSDIMRLYSEPPPPGIDATVAFVRDLEREAEPGAMWRYKTPETNLAGVLVMEATGKSLAEYLAETIWQPVGMEMNATWLVDHIGNEQGGCCLQASLRDYARFGQFILEGARIEGEPILPEGWLDAATSEQAATGVPGGYGYQWWPLGDGTFQARGIFGQLIHLDPARDLVVVISAAWPEPAASARRGAQFALAREIAAAIDAESAAVN